MERFKKLKRVIILLILLFVLNLIMLILMIPVRSFMTWGVIGVQLVVVLYFSAISFGLLKEVQKDKPDGDDQ